MSLSDHSPFTPCHDSVSCAECFNNLVDIRRQVVWMLTPKAASMSVREAIGQRDPADRHGDAKQWRWHSKSALMTLFAGYFRVGFVRNPFDRLVSCWVNRVKSGFYNYFPRYGITPGMSFQEFVETALSFDAKQADRHWRPISVEYISKDTEIPDYICYVENIDDDWKQLINTPRLKGVPPLARHHHSKHLPYQNYYTENTKQLVAQYYADDLARFGYAF